MTNPRTACRTRLEAAPMKGREIRDALHAGGLIYATAGNSIGRDPVNAIRVQRPHRVVHRPPGKQRGIEQHFPARDPADAANPLPRQEFRRSHMRRNRKPSGSTRSPKTIEVPRVSATAAGQKTATAIAASGNGNSGSYSRHIDFHPSDPNPHHVAVARDPTAGIGRDCPSPLPAAVPSSFRANQRPLARCSGEPRLGRIATPPGRTAAHPRAKNATGRVASLCGTSPVM